AGVQEPKALCRPPLDPRFRGDDESGGQASPHGQTGGFPMPLKRRQIAWRAAQDLADGAIVNLGTGLPTLVSHFIPADRQIVLHSENGVLGAEPAPGDNEVDWDLINSGKPAISLVTGGRYGH